MLETQGQMKTPSEDREQEKQNQQLQDLLQLLKDQILVFGDLQLSYNKLLDNCKEWIPKEKTKEKTTATISPEIQMLIMQGRTAELTVEQLAELDRFREPIT